jgi:hypothetical protein
MASREPYDRERIVNHVHDDPTEVIVREDAVRARRAEPREPVVVRPDDDVVVDHRAAPYEQVIVDRPAVVVAHDHDVVDDYHEDVTFDRIVARRAMLDRTSSVVWFFAGLLEACLALRVVFRLLEANEATGFVQFIYGLTDPFVAPFDGIFNDPVSDGAVLDTGALVAMVIYALVAWALVRLIWLLFDRPESGMYRSVSHIHHDRM